MRTPLRIHTATDYVVDQLNYRKRPEGRIHGHLCVCEAVRPGDPIMDMRLGSFAGLPSTGYPRGALLGRIHSLSSLHKGNEGPSIAKGFTSGDLGLGSEAGAVIIGDLVLGFLGYINKENDPKLDEALTLMIAIRAGLLSRRRVSAHRCVPGIPGFNPELRRLMDAITWAS
jgi:hypothetical protein